MQERLLAPRVLHYTRTSAIWECNTLTSCECQPGKSIALPSSLSLSTFGPSNIKKEYFSTVTWKSDAAPAWQCWRWIIQDFTDRGISFDKDRLPALSGVAGRFQSSGGVYLGGLWGNDMPLALLWFSLRSRPGRRPSPPAPLPPTWSWASVEEAQLSWPADVRPAMKAFSRVVSASTSPTTADKFGTVSGGVVVLEGRLLVAYIPTDFVTRNSRGQVRYHLCWCESLAEFIPDVDILTGIDACVAGDKLHCFRVTETYGLVLKPVRPPAVAADSPDPSQRKTKRNMSWDSLRRVLSRTPSDSVVPQECPILQTEGMPTYTRLGFLKYNTQRGTGKVDVEEMSGFAVGFEDVEDTRIVVI